MTYSATILEIMLASPSDVKEERVAARKVIAQWNSEHSRNQRVALLTMGWETHATADISGKRAQAIINEKIVEHADLMIGIFWTRLGSPTGKFNSGTLEEVKLQHKKKKPLMLYFSDAPISPSSIDPKQHEEVLKFRNWARGEGYVGSFNNCNDFQEKFRHELTIMLTTDPRLRALVAPPASSNRLIEPPLSSDAASLLGKVGTDHRGQLRLVLKDGLVKFLGAHSEIVNTSDTMMLLRWRSALDELLSRDLLKDKTDRNELFELTPKAVLALRSRVA